MKRKRRRLMVMKRKTNGDEEENGEIEMEGKNDEKVVEDGDGEKTDEVWSRNNEMKSVCGEERMK